LLTFRYIANRQDKSLCISSHSETLNDSFKPSLLIIASFMHNHQIGIIFTD